MIMLTSTHKAILAQHTAEIAYLRAMLEDATKRITTLETELDMADEIIDMNEDDVQRLKIALQDIADQRTSGANATVTRMANRAEKALDGDLEDEQAEFIEEEVKPSGTLAQLANMIRNHGTKKTGGVVSNSSDDTTAMLGASAGVALAESYDWTGLNDTGSSSDTFSGSGGSFGGGGSSSSYDSGSSYSDSSGGGSFD